jgi:hypothetical protein
MFAQNFLGFSIHRKVKNNNTLERVRFSGALPRIILLKTIFVGSYADFKTRALTSSGGPTFRNPEKLVGVPLLSRIASQQQVSMTSGRTR